MFKGDYNFFDYKYNIAGYNGQDYGSIAQRLYLVISIILLIVLLFSFRKLKKEKVLIFIRVISIFITLLYITKTIWESIYDIRLFGSFNTGLLPLDTCSLVMFAGLIAGFSHHKIKDYALAWLATGGVLGGIATMVILNALYYYPFFSFGAFYSMTWHFLMAFLGLLLIITKYIDLKYDLVLKGFIFHFLFSLIVIPLNYIFKWDFMMYRNMGSIPFFEDLGTKFNELNIGFLNPIIMLCLYFIAFNIIFFIALLSKKIIMLFMKGD